MEGETYLYNGEMILKFCITCGCPFTMPTKMEQQRRINQEAYYCPNGHPQSYIKSEAQEWKEKYERADSYIKEKNVRIEALENQNRALRGRITKLSKKKA